MTRRLPVRTLFALAAALCVLTAPAAASVTGYAEPAYTKTGANNTFWWSWNAVTGLNLDTNQYTYMWWMCYKTNKDGIQIETSDGTKGWNSPNCWLARSSSGGAASGTAYTYPFQPSTVLQDGSLYQMCVSGFNIYGFYNSYPSTALLWDGMPSACNSTRIDRNKPVIGVAVDGSAEFTNNPLLDVDIGYQDATSPPWLGSNGLASNWTCVSRTGPCTPGGDYDQACSAAQSRTGTTNAFKCRKDVSAQPDGEYHVCVIAADAAVPDNPSDRNQFANAYSQNANLSNVQCGWVTLDRQPPAVTVQAPATATVGQLVTLSASADDPAGVPGALDWDFGDNSAHAAGLISAHTYMQPGTYQVRVAARDGAGNAGQGTATIAVAPAASGGGQGGATGGATPTPAPLTPGAISQQAGGGGTQRATLAGLKVVAPKRFTAGRRTAVPLALTVTTAGRLQVALLRGARIVAKRGASFARAGTYALKLKVPRSLKAGRYALRLTFAPAGSARAVTKSLRLRVVRAGKAHRALAARAPAPAALRGCPAA